MSARVRQSLFWFLLVLMVILFVELCLQSFSIFYVYTQRSLPPDLFDTKKLRIVTLGESTTAGWDNWPYVMEKKLLGQGLNVKVFNLAVPGTNSFFQGELFRQEYDDLRPHIVISMLGINDKNIEFLRAYDPRHDSFWNGIKFVRLIRVTMMSLHFMATERTSSVKQMRLTEIRKDGGIRYKDSPRAVELGERLVNRMDQESSLIAVRDEVVRTLKREPIKVRLALLDYLIKFAPKRLYPDFQPTKEAKERYQYIKMYTELSVRHSQVNAIFMYWARRFKDYDSCFAYANRLLSEGVKVSGHYITRMAECAHEDISNVGRWNPILANYGIQLRNLHKNTTANVYKDIVRFAKSKEACFLAMQYALDPVEDLQAYFRDSKVRPDAFIDNLTMFNEVLKTVPKQEIFVDYFAGHFGHTSELGANLIADNVINVMRSMESKNSHCDRVKAFLAQRF